MWRSEVSLGSLSLKDTHFTFWVRVLHWTWGALIQLDGWMANELQGTPCLCLPSTGITNTHHHGAGDQIQVLILILSCLSHLHRSHLFFCVFVWLVLIFEMVSHHIAEAGLNLKPSLPLHAGELEWWMCTTMLGWKFLIRDIQVRKWRRNKNTTFSDSEEWMSIGSAHNNC